MNIRYLAFFASLLLGIPSTQAQDTPPSAEAIPLSQSGAHLFAPGQIPRPQEPLRLSPGPHLLIDDYYLETIEQLTRVVNVPKRDPNIPNPVITGKEDGCFQPYLTVLRDPESNRFRMWYGHCVEDRNSGRSHIGYLESGDGIHWERPARILQDPGSIQFGVSVVDDGPGCANPAQRYKYAWWMDGGMKLATSPDGLAWTALAPDPVIRHNHDITSISWDPLRNRYVATISVYRQGDDWSGDRRITMQSHSTDLSNWSPPRYVVQPNDAIEPGQTQFYAMEGFLARGDLIIGMVKVLHDDYKADDPPVPPEAYGVGYTQLAWTRDGENWYRDPVTFFDRAPEPEAWDHAHAWIDEQVSVGDQVFLYYGGYAHGHKVNRFEERQIGLVTIPRDRYAGWAAQAAPGRIITPALLLDGHKLSLNLDAKGGSVQVQLLDAAGKPLPGFTFADMTPITADALDARLQWKRPLTELDNHPLRIEMRLENTTIFAINLTK